MINKIADYTLKGISFIGFCLKGFVISKPSQKAGSVRIQNGTSTRRENFLFMIPMVIRVWMDYKKIIVDTHVGIAPCGEGAFSCKDSRKVGLQVKRRSAYSGTPLYL